MGLSRETAELKEKTSELEAWKLKHIEIINYRVFNMEPIQLFNKMRILFDHERANYRKRISPTYSPSWTPKPYNNETRFLELGIRLHGTTVVKDPQNYMLKFENMKLLTQLYNLLNGQEKDTFIEYLFVLANYEQYDAIAYLPFETLIKIGQIGVAMDFAISKKQNEISSSECAFRLITILTFEHNRFTDKELETIDSKSREMDISNPRFLKKEVHFPSEYIIVLEAINQIQQRRLAKELSETPNFEINRDKENLKQNLDKFKFSKDLQMQVDKIEEIYNKATNDIDFRDCLENSRLLLDSLQKELAKKIINTSGPQIKGNMDKAIDVRKYLTDQKIYTDKECKLIESIYGFTSDEGTHKLKSTKERARLGKNMTIEVAYIISEKFGQNITNTDNNTNI